MRPLAGLARRARPAAIAGVLTAVVLAGCGSVPAPSLAPTPSAVASSASPGTPASCDLAPGLATLVGRATLAAPSDVLIGALDRCTWIFGADPARSVDLTVGPGAIHDEAIEAFGAGETVPGLGDDARWWATSRTLSVRVGERAFQVGLQLDPELVRRELAVAIAGEVLARLG